MSLAERVAARFRLAGKTLKVGDRVKWRGGFGRHPAVEARVSEMALVSAPKSKDDIADLKEAPWALVKDDWVIVVVKTDEGGESWAYGNQVDPA